MPEVSARPRLTAAPGVRVARLFTGNVERVDEDRVGYGDAALIERWSRQIDQLSALP